MDKIKEIGTWLLIVVVALVSKVIKIAVGLAKVFIPIIIFLGLFTLYVLYLK